MRNWFFFILLFALSSANAGTLETCRKKEKDKEAVRSCVKAARITSINQLREAGSAAQAAVWQKIRETGRKTYARQYRASQARHVRERNAACRMLSAGIEKSACEADMNNAQVEQLARFIE
jgi:hypothetical protein